jgi:hypothetical protein
MNGKKAKTLRRLAKEEGKYQQEPNYKVKETEKVVYGKDKNGLPIAGKVTRYTVVNLSRIEFRRLKQAYVNGEFTVG